MTSLQLLSKVFEKRTAGRIGVSIAAADLGNLREEVKRVEAAQADFIHIDIMDGVFVPNITFGPWVLEVVREATRLPLDCHLMVSRPQDWIQIVAQAGADYITVHVESVVHLHRLLERIKALGKKAGVALNPGSPVSQIENALDWVDVVQVMSVDPGFSGQHFIPNALAKVRALEDLRKARTYLIEIDGGVSSENIRSVHEAGADLLVLGSFIFTHQDLGPAVGRLKAQVR